MSRLRREDVDVIEKRSEVTSDETKGKNTMKGSYPHMVRQLAVWLLCSCSAWASVSLDAKVSSGVQFTATAIPSTNITISSSANRAAIACLYFASNTPSSISVTVGGVSGTLISGTDTASGKTDVRTACYCVINPASGAQTFSASWSGSANADMGVITATGVDQVIGCNNGTSAVSNGSNGLSLSVTVTSNTGDLSVAIGGEGGGFPAMNYYNQTTEWGPDSSAAFGGVGPQPSAGNVTHTATGSFASDDVAISGANFKATGVVVSRGATVLNGVIVQ